MHNDKRFVRSMFGAGAAGFLLKKSAVAELTQAIRVVAAGHMYLSPLITGAVVEDFVGKAADKNEDKTLALSSREREVLQLLAEGKKSHEIAETLHVSIQTVGTHRRHVMNKLGLYSVAELTQYAIREGLVFSNLKTRAISV